MTKSEKRRKYCGGCRQNFYNGNNPLGIRECWHLKDAKVVRRAFVHINDVPPWHSSVEKTLHCHSRDRFIAVKPDHPQLITRARRERAARLRRRAAQLTREADCVEGIGR